LPDYSGQFEDVNQRM